MSADRSGEPNDSQRDRILHGIGRVAQAHVGLDLKLRQLQIVLGTPLALAGQLADTDVPAAGWNFKKVVGECRSRLVAGPWDEDFKAAGTGVLAEALNVNELRDRVVHDMWVERPMEESQNPSVQRWQIQRGGYAFSPHASDLEFIDKTELRLRRVEIRANEMMFYAMSAMAGAPDDPEGATGTEQLRIIKDQFTLLGNGVYQAHPPESNDTAE